MKTYNRQFAITQTPAWLHGWSTYASFNRFIHISSYLELTQSSDKRISLIGYAIDPRKPEFSNQQIINSLATSSSDSIIKVAAQLAGRWVLLCEFPDREFILHDACGLRQVFYSDKFIASQTTAANEFLHLEIDEEATRGFLETNFVRNNDEYWWPGDATQYKGVCCLLPNHYLDLKSMTTHRYGLDKIQQGHWDGSAEILTALIAAASRRFDLALPLTAGWDSRTILAACIKVGIKPHCYTLKWGERTNAHQDLRIPPQLIDWPHQIIECPAHATDEFDKAFRASVDPSHDSSIPMGLWNGYPKGRVSLSGHCSEVARCFYRERNAGVTPEYLAEITGMDKTPFVLRKFGAWLSDAVPEVKRCGINILDLLYWEQRAGRWAANGQAQWDIVHERFTPFNHRPLIFALLSAPEYFRKSPNYLLYRHMIENMAPHLLKVPINPDSTKKRTIFRKALGKLRSLTARSDKSDQFHPR